MSPAWGIRRALSTHIRRRLWRTRDTGQEVRVTGIHSTADVDLVYYRYEGELRRTSIFGRRMPKRQSRNGRSMPARAFLEAMERVA